MTTATKACEILKEQYARKNADYGNSAHSTYLQFGDVAYMTRLSDKLNRWEQLRKKPAQVADESLVDTMGDTCTYCCMWLAEQFPEDENAVLSIMDEARNFAVRTDANDLPTMYETLVAQFKTFTVNEQLEDVTDWAIRMAICALSYYTETINSEVKR